MDNAEARGLLAREMQVFRAEPYERLVSRIAAGELVREVRGASGAEYQIEISFAWDDAANGNVRAIGSIDDGGWRAFVPLTASFIKAPDGTFVGEPAVGSGKTPAR